MADYYYSNIHKKNTIKTTYDENVSKKTMSQCKKFAPNIFHKTKCSNCFRQKEEHSAEALECNRECRSIARSGYLFVAPDWDFSVPLNRTKRWQRRWFVLYDDGELNYSVDEHPDTIPQGSVDMSKVMEVTGAEQVTGHPHSLALTSPDRVTFVKAASREDARWWAELLAVFPRRHKRNATFPGGRASPSLPQLGRSASPQPPRPRHLSCTGPSPRTNFETPPLKEERESPPKDELTITNDVVVVGNRSGWLPEPSGNVLTETVPIINPIRTNDCLITSGSPPTRDKLRCEDKARSRRDWRNERLRDIATALTDRSPEQSLALPAESLLHMKKGWLWLKTPSDDLDRRWVVLSGRTLNIYPDQDEQSTADIVVELTSVTSYDEIPTDSKYAFEVRWAGPTLVLNAVTSGIRSNWLQALKKAAPIIVAESPTTPPRSVFSSDEEYRTASDGGRRGSADWSELPPSPPLTNRSLLLRSSKDRIRLRPRLPRCQSRQSTLDSTSTDEIDSVKLSDSTGVELNNAINRQNIEIGALQKKLCKAEAEVLVLEEEIARLKKFQADVAIQEMKANERMAAFERTERELNQRNSQAEAKFAREQRSLQRQLVDAEDRAKLYEDRCSTLTRELQSKQRILSKLQSDVTETTESLTKSRSDNERLNRRLDDFRRKNRSSVQVDSLTDLINIDLDVDIDGLGQNELKEYCLDLRGRFERAVLEIRAVKRELRDSQSKVDALEVDNYGLGQALDAANEEKRSEVELLVARLNHLTSKLSQAEKQVRNRSRSESRDKRRSLSLKGRESFSINKEVEDKVTELEAKIVALERGRTRRKHKRDRSSERSSPIDDKSLRRLRRKSLDSATSSEPMKLLMRLSALENKVTVVNASTESLNSDDLSKSKLKECLHHLNLLKTSLKRPSSPSIIDRHLLALETNLNETVANENEVKAMHSEVDVINASANAAVKQLENLLIEKLSNLAEKKRDLRERNQLDSHAKLEMLAEKVAFENILISRIQEAFTTSSSGEIGCDRLIRKETAETANLMLGLSEKLAGRTTKIEQRSGADYLSRVLAKCLMTSSSKNFIKYRNYVRADSTTLAALEDERHKVESAFVAYRNVKLPQLAEALAFESAALAVDASCRLNDITDDFSRSVRDSVNCELIQSEINHVMLRAAQMYQNQNDSDQRYFFSFFAVERATLELWSDSVNDRLHDEISRSVDEISEAYRGCLAKLQRQNWRRRVESERNRSSASLLQEYADVIAHKAIIDARLDVLSGNLTEDIDRNDDLTPDLHDWLENERCWDRLDRCVQIDHSLQVEFGCMVDRIGKNCYGLMNRSELDDVLSYLNDLADEICQLQKLTNTPSIQNNLKSIENLNDVCSICRTLRNKLEDVRRTLGRNSPRGIARSHSFKRFESLEELRPVFLGTEYLTQVEALRSAHRRAIASCKDTYLEIDIEQLQVLCERVLGSMELWHKRTIQEMRDGHAEELELLRQEKEQALAEETQATLAALDAMRKAHEAEVQREVAKFKQDWSRQQRDDILDLSERLSVKCLEAASLEEELGRQTRQLTHAQQHILQLERNPQLS